MKYILENSFPSYDVSTYIVYIDIFILYIMGIFSASVLFAIFRYCQTDKRQLESCFQTHTHTHVQALNSPTVIIMTVQNKFACVCVCVWETQTKKPAKCDK